MTLFGGILEPWIVPNVTTQNGGDAKNQLAEHLSTVPPDDPFRGSDWGSNWGSLLGPISRPLPDAVRLLVMYTWLRSLASPYPILLTKGTQWCQRVSQMGPQIGPI